MKNVVFKILIQNVYFLQIIYKIIFLLKNRVLTQFFIIQLFILLLKLDSNNNFLINIKTKLNKISLTTFNAQSSAPNTEQKYTLNINIVKVFGLRAEINIFHKRARISSLRGFLIQWSRSTLFYIRYLLFFYNYRRLLGLVSNYYVSIIFLSYYIQIILIATQQDTSLMLNNLLFWHLSLPANIQLFSNHT